MITRLFVYGSLKRSQPNHAVLARAQFVGECRTSAQYRLFALGPYPALSPGGNTSILGELYLVDETQLTRLDEFEGPEYFRSLVTLLDGDRAEAYLLADHARPHARELDVNRWPAD